MLPKNRRSVRHGSRKTFVARLKRSVAKFHSLVENLPEFCQIFVRRKTYINKVRERAGLGEVGTYKISLNGADSIMPTTEQALRHERRVELAMEGHRWFDLVRWQGVDGKGLKEHMDAYAKTESADAQSHIQAFVAGKHEIFPIPQEEIQLNPTEMEQNPGY